MQYLVIEIQTFDTGAITTQAYAFKERKPAESKYFAILSAAALSKLPRHACVLLTNQGLRLMSGCYDNATQGTEPATTE